MWAPGRRAEVLDLVLDRARVDPRVTGAALTGSGAAGTADRWSDVDVVLCPAGDARLVDVIADWTAFVRDDLGAVHHVDLTGGGATYRAFLLADGLEVDLQPGPDRAGPGAPHHDASTAR